MNAKRILFLLLLIALAVVLAAGCGDDDDNDADADDDTVGDDDDDNDADDDDDNDDSSPSPTAIAPGVYSLTGTDTHGDYTGTAEVYLAEKGYEFVRLVSYPDLTFADAYKDIDYEVHSAWLGQVDPDKLSVSLQVGDFISAYGDLARDAEIDGPRVVIEATATPTAKDGYTVTYASAPEASREYAATETWTFQEAGGETPIFLDEDETRQSHEEMSGFLKTLVNIFLREYHALEFYDDYRDRPEFEAGIHYFHHYRTDFEWYRDHPDTIRVVNKWLDEISMAETMLRSRAYGPTLAEKAAFFDEEMPLYFLNPQGMFSEAVVDSVPLHQKESGDALLWSGCYLASQVWRYLVTGEQEALDNWLLVLDGEFLAHDIPQDNTTFARAVRPHVADGSKEWVQGAAPYEDYDWLTGGNNDMIKGLYYSYLMSYLYLPNEPQYDVYRQGIADRAVILADYAAIARDGNFNEMTANLLAYLTNGEQRFLDRYDEIWSNLLYEVWTFIGDGMFYLWGVSDWSGQHLNTVGTIVLYQLIEATGADGLGLFTTGWTNGMRLNGVTGQVMWPIAAYSFSEPAPDTLDVLDFAIWRLREIPFPKETFDIDHRIDPEWCASPLPSLFWKLDYFQGGRHQGIYGAPFWEFGGTTNYYKDGPFRVSESHGDLLNGGGADFLQAYWMGRYYDVIDENE